MDAKVRGNLHSFRMGLMCVTAVWSVSALAASGPCDNSGRRLQTLSVSVEALAAQPVDHVGVTLEATAVPKPAESVNQAVAPLLYLTPHIAAILNSVFENADVLASQEPVTQETVTEASKPATTASAPQATASDVEDETTPVNNMFRNDDIARFRRQMYRKDI